MTGSAHQMERRLAYTSPPGLSSWTTELLDLFEPHPRYLENSRAPPTTGRRADGRQNERGLSGTGHPLARSSERMASAAVRGPPVAGQSLQRGGPRRRERQFKMTINNPTKTKSDPFSMLNGGNWTPDGFRRHNSMAHVDSVIDGPDWQLDGSHNSRRR